MSKRTYIPLLLTTLVHILVQGAVRAESSPAASKPEYSAAAVGSTVDIARATYDNSIGDAMQTAYWADPDFDPDERAFYYVRVIEIPTPRWTAYDARRFGTEMPPEVRMIVQDRAYTSPVWYTP